MRKSKSVGFIFGWTTYVLAVSALILLICAGIASGQSWNGYANTPGGQYQYAPFGQDSGQGAGQTYLPSGENSYSLQTNAEQSLPSDWPQTIDVEGLDMTGLISGNNNVSYAIKVMSQDDNTINFQVKAFCVYNAQSQYAILHTLKAPLSGVIDRQKNTLQIDFSQLPQAIDSIKVIDVGDVDQALLQSKDLMVLNTVMSVDSSDSSAVRFSISDMSLLQPDGVLSDLAIPDPVQGVYDIGDSRFSTFAYPELANMFQENYVAVQQNTFINVVNQVNVINVVNVGGCGYGGYGGYGGFGGYGDYGGYGGGCVPYTDPLPLQSYDASQYSPLRVPDKVHTHGDLHSKYRGDKRDDGGRDDIYSHDTKKTTTSKPTGAVKGKDSSIKATGTPKATSKSKPTVTKTATPSTKKSGLSASKPDAAKTAAKPTTVAGQASQQTSKPKATAKAAAKPTTTAKTVSKPTTTAKTVSKPTTAAKTVAKPTTTAKQVTEPSQKTKSAPDTKTVTAPSSQKTTSKQPAKAQAASAPKAATKSTPQNTKSVKSTKPTTQQTSSSHAAATKADSKHK